MPLKSVNQQVYKCGALGKNGSHYNKECPQHYFADHYYLEKHPSDIIHESDKDWYLSLS